jgi:hypothetical protein
MPDNNQSDFMHRNRKFGTRVLTVEARRIRDADTCNGVVVQTVRDDTGMLLESEVLDAKQVEERGLPLPTHLLTK